MCNHGEMSEPETLSTSGEPDWDPSAIAAFDNPLPRLTKRVFTDLAIWMIGLGVLMGIAFPFFAVLFGVPSEFVYTVTFFAATLGAGLVVGGVNHFLSSLVVRSRLQFMGTKMAEVQGNLLHTTWGDDPSACTPEDCLLPVDSDDEIGEAAASFNGLVEALATSQRSMMIARGFATTLSSHIELKALVAAALSDLQISGNFNATGLCLVRDGQLSTIASNGLDESTDIAESALVIRAYRTLEPVRVEVPDDVLIDAGVVSFRPRSIIAFPLQTRLVPIGVLVLASATEIGEDEERLIEQLLPNFAVALNNALSHERLQRVAALDPLTGLYNRRFGLERLSQDFSRSVRSSEPLGIVMFDVDHFKAVNDTYGHDVGDRVLQIISESVKQVLREGDTVMRYGGEEFLAVLPGAGDHDLRGLSERIRRVVESNVVHSGTAEIRVTVSLGGLSIPKVEVADVDDMIRKADAAMYTAKKTGRNRLTVVEG